MWAFIGYGLAFGVGVGICIFVLVWIPLFIYGLPYVLWAGWNQGKKGVPTKFESDKLTGKKHIMHNVKNATKLYRSWITHQPHNITNW